MSPGGGMPRISRFVLWGGFVSFWVVQLALSAVAGVPIVDSVLLALILVALPTLTLVQLPAIHGLAIERLPAYWGSIGTLWLLGTACWFVGTRDGGAAALGAVGMAPGPMLAWGLGLAVAGLATVLVFRQVAGWLRVEETPILRELLPRTGQERVVFALLSVAAGTGEEIAFRGYAIPLLVPLLGVPGGVVLTSVVFGVLHAYQGGLGMVRTGVMGAVLAWGFLASGSLWPPVIAHTLIDLAGGILLGDWLTSPPSERGVGSGPNTPSL